MASTNRLEETMAGLNRALGAFAVTCATSLSHVQAFGVAVVDLRRPYLAAGAPYGDTDEGLARWLEEGAALLRAAHRARVSAQEGRLLKHLSSLP